MLGPLTCATCVLLCHAMPCYAMPCASLSSSAATRAVADGVRLTNFFAWSFTDNWEWREGFDTRFGLVSNLIYNL